MSVSVSTLSPHQALLLAAHLTAHADIGALSRLISQHRAVLSTELVLRVLLTYLPETVPSSEYVGLLRRLSSAGDEHTDDDKLVAVSGVAPDTAPVDGLTAEEAARRVRKLRLLRLGPPGGDLLARFLVQRAYRVDEEAGLLAQLPSLLGAFSELDPATKTFAVSVVLPWCRRNCEYYSQTRAPQSLAEFEGLSSASAITALLSETANPDQSPGAVGRDLGGLIGPWLHNEARWERATSDAVDASDVSFGGWTCPGWESVLEWFGSQASRNWPVAVQALVQWMGPDDLDLGPYGETWLGGERLGYLRHRYLRAGLAAAYLIAQPSVDALNGAYMMSARLRSLILLQDSSPLQDAALDLEPVSEVAIALVDKAGSGVLRNGLFRESNVLTTPSEPAVLLLQVLVLSAYLLSKAGCPFTVRQAGELRLLGDEREQVSAVKSMLRAFDRSPSKSEEGFWARARCEILWLHDWGRGLGDGRGSGIFGRAKREVIEAEILDALLANLRHSLATSIYESDTPNPPLPAKCIQDAVVSAAMNAYDKASNPNRTRGGLKRCSDIVHAFPRTFPPSHEAARRIECLLKATHTLSDYRLVLKQGSPFSPVVLRTHSDPISIIGRVLEQNPKSYTKLQDFLDLGANLVKAGLGSHSGGRSGRQQQQSDDEGRRLLVAERRVMAMGIDAALREDDFETAYSYVVNRLEGLPDLPRSKDASPDDTADQWSWAAALRAGQYVRTSRSTRPTHIGTASGNPEIRHLEQRLECLATALRIAPAAQLQEILETFRRCEEQLDAALRREAASEDAWNTAADLHKAAPVPGAFLGGGGGGVPVERTQPAITGDGDDEAPMSLFDLTARIASQNLSALSGLQRVAGGGIMGEGYAEARGGREAATAGAEAVVGGDGGEQQPRTRRRDQLRDAAVGTLVSGVGWLVGAQPVQQQLPREQQEERAGGDELDDWGWS